MKLIFRIVLQFIFFSRFDRFGDQRKIKAIETKVKSRSFLKWWYHDPLFCFDKNNSFEKLASNSIKASTKIIFDRLKLLINDGMRFFGGFWTLYKDIFYYSLRLVIDYSHYLKLFWSPEFFGIFNQFHTPRTPKFNKDSNKNVCKK
jgi:hypothetical protein